MRRREWTVVTTRLQVSASPGLRLLGSSPQSAIWAAELGLRYAFADFINPGGSEIAKQYASHFTPVRDLFTPRVAVAAWVLCADTDEEAQELASSSRMTFTLLRRGQLIAVPPPETAMAFLAREGRGASGDASGRRGIVGTPEKVRDQLETLASEYGADEVIVVTITHDHGARKRSYELLAEAMSLAPRPVSGGGETQPLHRLGEHLRAHRVALERR